MGKKPVATIGSMHICPMVTGLTPHVGGPVIGPCIPGVLIDGKPVAVIGDQCTCTGPPDTIVTGCPGVLVDGKPVALVGSLTAHGGQITMGVPGVTISSESMKPAVIPFDTIPFPKISIVSRLTAPKQTGEADKKIKEVKQLVEEKDDKQPSIFNIRWRKGERNVSEGFCDENYIISADTWGLDDGERVKFYVNLKPVLAGEQETAEEKEDTIVELTGEVKDGRVEVEWTPSREELEKERKPDE